MLSTAGRDHLWLPDHEHAFRSLERDMYFREDLEFLNAFEFVL